MVNNMSAMAQVFYVWGKKVFNKLYQTSAIKTAKHLSNQASLFAARLLV